MTFNFQDIDDFDRHIELSIPNYSGLIQIIKALFTEFMPVDGTCLDIGCSTGKLLNELSAITPAKYIGVDEAYLIKDSDFTFYQSDAVDYLKSSPQKIDVILSIFTLQFMSKYKREAVLNYINQKLTSDGVFIVAEKFYMQSSKIDSIMKREHYRQKRKVFTDKEIMDKDYQLLGSMFCRTKQEIIAELSEIGYVEQIWQSYNFGAWIVRK